MISSNTHRNKLPSPTKVLRNTYNSSFTSLKKKKLLPHIHEEYSFRITNRLLIYKIMHPKRDKNITDSLLHTSLSQTINNQSQISSFGSHSRKNIGPKKQYPTQRYLQQAENQFGAFNDNKSKIKAQNLKSQQYQFLNDKTNSQIANYDRKQLSNTSRERMAGKIMKNNFMGHPTIEIIQPQRSQLVQSGFIMRQKQSEPIIGESGQKRGKLRRNLRFKLKCSIEQTP